MVNRKGTIKKLNLDVIDSGGQVGASMETLLDLEQIVTELEGIDLDLTAIESGSVVVEGLSWKGAVVVATTANGVLATAYENGDTIDGIVLSTGDRILLKDQTSGDENGIYTVNASGAPTRATDFDADSEVVGGAAVVAAEGTANADTIFILTTDDPIVIGTTVLVFASLSVSGAIATEDEGISVDTTANTLNFVGAGVTATDAGGGQTDVTIPGGVSGIATEDEGISVDLTATTLNFVGAGVVASDAGAGQTDITIPAVANTVATEDENISVDANATTLNFVGAGVTATDAGGGQTDITIPAVGNTIATQEEGGSVDTTADTLNFIGAGVTAADAGGGVTSITIPGAANTIATEDEGGSVDSNATTLNFVGAGVVASDSGGGVTAITIPDNTDALSWNQLTRLRMRAYRLI